MNELFLKALAAAEDIIVQVRLREARGDFFCTKQKLDEKIEEFERLAAAAREVAK